MKNFREISMPIRLETTTPIAGIAVEILAAIMASEKGINSISVFSNEILIIEINMVKIYIKIFLMLKTFEIK